MVMSYSGFEKEERDKVKYMIALTGAKVTAYFSMHNHVLICRRYVLSNFMIIVNFVLPFQLVCPLKRMITTKGPKK